jgi:sn-glycerol 3-phosphate transport system substrate-binding protein
MTGATGDVIVRLADEFNASQRDYRVVPVYKGGYPDTQAAGLAAFRLGTAPAILQVYEVGTATMVASGATKPVYELMREAGEPFDISAYLSAVASYYADARGNLLSLPFNASSLVTWVNRDAFRKAGLDPARLPRTWPEIFAAARKLRTSGYSTCGFTTAWTTWTNLEQFSAWHNVPLATLANGFGGLGTELVFNRTLQVRHLQNLRDLQKDRTFDYSGRTTAGETRFINGECPLLLSSSALHAPIAAGARFDWAAAPMPYYPDVPGAPQNAIIGGASLWAMGGKSPNEYRGVAKFFAFLSGADRQARLHQETGYLPITRAAYALTQQSGFYARHAWLETALLQVLNKEPTENSRGLRLGHMTRLRDIWAEEMESALGGEKSAQAALDAAVARGNEVLRGFEAEAGRR